MKMSKHTAWAKWPDAGDRGNQGKHSELLLGGCVLQSKTQLARWRPLSGCQVISGWRNATEGVPYSA